MSFSTMPTPKYPCESIVRSTSPYVSVTIPMSEQEHEEAAPSTVGDMFLSAVRAFPDRAAIRFKESDTSTSSVWTEITFADYYRFALQAAKSFVKVRYGLVAIAIERTVHLRTFTTPTICLH